MIVSFVCAKFVAAWTRVCIFSYACHDDIEFSEARFSWAVASTTWLVTAQVGLFYGRQHLGEKVNNVRHIKTFYRLWIQIRSCSANQGGGIRNPISTLIRHLRMTAMLL